MNKNLSKMSAIAASCIMISSAFCSCADEDKGESHFNGNQSASYVKDETNNDACEESSPDAYEESRSEASESRADNNEEYNDIIESGFKNADAEPLSTFSIDVDTASYTNVRRLIEDAQEIPDGAVRIEEFLNYFDYDYPEPENGEAFSRYVEIADCSWNPSSKLMMVGIQAKDAFKENEKAPASNLVFLIDSSGSMADYNKLPLVQSAFSLLAEKLTEYDRISIVTYANGSDTVINGVRGDRKDDILEALYSISASGATNGEGGIKTAYEIAEQNFVKNGNNRVIIATDGDMNVGASSEAELTKLIESKRNEGIYLSVFGFGTDNIKDNRMEALADNGNGNYCYIDSIDEAYRVLVNEMSGTLYTVAKDVKIQVEFNPSQVESYRLLGYDNRLMDAHDFIDDSKDAGEAGSGRSVTALYEIKLTDSGSTYDGIKLEFASEHNKKASSEPKETGRTEICKLSVAYKDVNTERGTAKNESEYLSDLFGMEKYSEKPSERIVLAGAAAEFAMLLKNSEFKGDSSYEHVLDTVNALSMKDEKVSELYGLVKAALNLYD